jgi:hypothetical protein
MRCRSVPRPARPAGRNTFRPALLRSSGSRPAWLAGPCRGGPSGGTPGAVFGTSRPLFRAFGWNVPLSTPSGSGTPTPCSANGLERAERSASVPPSPPMRTSRTRTRRGTTHPPVGRRRLVTPLPGNAAGHRYQPLPVALPLTSTPP